VSVHYLTSIQIYIMKVIKLTLSVLCLLVISSCSEDPEFKGPGIHNYYCTSGRMRLGGGMRNASGITFNHDTGTLFIIQDSPPWIHEVNDGGEIIRTIKMSNANDTEGIAYMGNDLFAILEESTSKIYFCILDGKTGSLDLKEAINVISVNQPDKNTGLEGLTYLPEQRMFFAVKEKDPRVIYAIDYESGQVKEPWDLKKIKIDDASDICYNHITGNLLLLSHESRKIIEVDLKGNKISELVLEKKRNGLKRDIKKPEGITVDPKTGTIYICGEKEEFYIFKDATKK
jgi:uncharacterized protein YjiK